MSKEENAGECVNDKLVCLCGQALKHEHDLNLSGPIHVLMQYIMHVAFYPIPQMWYRDN